MVKAASLEVSLGKLKLRSPIVLCSGTAGFGQELKGILNFRKIGALITKTITLDSYSGNPPPRITEVSCGVLNSIGLENPGVNEFINKYKDLRKLDLEVIVSIYGKTAKDFQKIILKLNKIKQIKALELNLSCPNIKTKRMISQSPRATYKLIRALRKETKKTLIAKLTPEVTDIVKVAQAAKDGGIDSLSLVNTFLGMKIDVEKRKPSLGNLYGGLSGPAIKPLALYKVYKVYKELKIPIIASGGIWDYKDALEFVLAGATCLGLGTINMIDPDRAGLIGDDLISYMKKNKISNLRQIRGMVCE